MQLHRAAHDLRLLVQSSVAVPEPEPITDELPALTAPLVIVTPHPEHWILLGALVIVAAWVLMFVYVSWANRHHDAAVHAIRESR